MPVFISVVRTAQCCICNGQWILDPMEHPEKCIHCGSLDWQWGAESRDSAFIRQGLTRLRKSLNPGAKSRNRQQQGRKQWRRFRSKEQDDAKSVEKRKPKGEN